MYSHWPISPEPIKPELLDAAAYRARCQNYHYDDTVYMLSVFEDRLATLGPPPLTEQLLLQLERQYGDKLTEMFSFASQLWEGLDEKNLVFEGSEHTIGMHSIFLHRTGSYEMRFDVRLPSYSLSDMANKLGIQPAALMLLDKRATAMYYAPPLTRITLAGKTEANVVLCEELAAWMQRAVTMTLHLLNLSAFVRKVEIYAYKRSSTALREKTHYEKQILAAISPEWGERHRIDVDNPWIRKSLDWSKSPGMIKLVREEMDKVLLLNMAAAKDEIPENVATIGHALVYPYAKG